MRAALAALVLAATLALSACGGLPDASAPANTDAPPAAATAPAPAGLVIPALELAAPLARTGLDAGGEVIEPDVATPEVAAWVDAGPTPGEVGRALIVGHVNGGGRAGVFADLARLPVGAEIRVTDAAGAEQLYTVREVSQWDKGAFPRGKVYGDTSVSALALVTCGGTFDQSSGHYRDNIVVLADRV